MEGRRKQRSSSNKGGETGAQDHHRSTGGGHRHRRHRHSRDRRDRRDKEKKHTAVGVRRGDARAVVWFQMTDMCFGPSPETIGLGSSSCVYAAYAKSIDRHVAIKVGGGSHSKQIHHEVDLHLRIPRTPYFGRAVGTLYVGPSSVLCPSSNSFALGLVTILVRGCSLKYLVSQSETIPVKDVVLILSNVCDGLTAIHGAGLVHMDMSVSNVMIHVENDTIIKAVIIDIGLGRESGTELTDAQVAERAQERFVYLSNEREVSPASDVYSFGFLVKALVDNMKVDDPDAGSFSQCLRDIESCCVDYCPQERITVPQIKEILAGFSTASRKSST